MYILRKENGLFLEWKRFLPKEEREKFVFDGVVDENEWIDTPFNVLLLLKEVNGGECSWDEREYLSEYYEDEDYISTHSKSIDSMLIWLHGIFHCSSKTSWDEVCSQMSDEHNSWLLKQIALVNIKKTPGTGTTDYHEFDTFFNVPQNREFLSKQLSIYNPDLVICGNTAYYLQKVDAIYAKNNWKKTHSGISYLRINNTIYLDFVHPLARIPKNYMFYVLMDALEEINILEKLGWDLHRHLPLK